MGQVSIVEPSPGVAVADPVHIAGTSTSTGSGIVEVVLKDGVTGASAKGTAVPGADGTWSTAIGWGSFGANGDPATICASLQDGVSSTNDTGPITLQSASGGQVSDPFGALAIPVGTRELTLFASVPVANGFNVFALWQLLDDNLTPVADYSRLIKAGDLDCGSAVNVFISPAAVWLANRAFIESPDTFCNLAGLPVGCTSSVTVDFQTTFSPDSSQLGSSCVTVSLGSVPTGGTGGGGTPGVGGTSTNIDQCCQQLTALLNQVLAAVNRSFPQN